MMEVKFSRGVASGRSAPLSIWRARASAQARSAAGVITPISSSSSERTRRRRTQVETYRHILHTEHEGVKKVVHAAAYLRDRYPAQGLWIGSGMVEAACKTLEMHRMKRSGMH